MELKLGDRVGPWEVVKEGTRFGFRVIVIEANIEAVEHSIIGTRAAIGAFLRAHGWAP